MRDFKNKHKKLYRSYGKRLEKLHKDSFEDHNPTEYFVTYLRLLRDYHLLASPYLESIGEDSFELASLLTAISEYEKSQTCFHKYYKVENGVTSRLIEGTEEEVMTKYSKEKAFHWDAFWNLVKLSLESWVPNDKL